MKRGDEQYKGRHHAEKGTDRFGGTLVPYRSDLEKQIMAWLDASPDVVEWMYEPFDLDIPGRVPHRPDFLVTMVDGSRRLVEGKGGYWVSRNPEDESKKADAAKAWCEQNAVEYWVVWHEDVNHKELAPAFQPFFSAISGSAFGLRLKSREKAEQQEIDLLMAGGGSPSPSCSCGYLDVCGADLSDCPVCGFA
ncbi:MAG: hypothetical protein ACI9K2_002194 [Myxococcota bacterium]|jgi:hypothetical protein